MLAVVVNTGANTNFHTVVALVAKSSLDERSLFQKMVIRIGDILIMLTSVLVIIIIMVALFHHEHFLEIARFALVLTVASIPMALPAVLSVTMAVGVVNLARRQAIVSPTDRHLGTGGREYLLLRQDRDPDFLRRRNSYV